MKSDLTGKILAWCKRWRYIGILFIGLIIPQLIIYAPSFFDGKVLLPLDFLARAYDVRGVEVNDPVISDPVTTFEPWRRYFTDEVSDGRWPLWTPDNYGGAPFSFPGFSPFHLVYLFWPSPHCLVWVQLLKTLFAGLGAYLFLRRAIQVKFWPAAIASWCLPLTGFYTVWQSFYATHTAAFLPWILLATHAAINAPRAERGIIGLACVTGFTLVCGQIDIALQAMLISGIYALWLIAGTKAKGSRMMFYSAMRCTAGWLVGFMLAAPFLLPLFEYIPSGVRMMERATGVEARPPVGLSALPQLLIPDFYGTTRAGWMFLGKVNVPESAAAGFTGMILTLFLVPLAWCNKARWRESFFWLGLVFFAASWTLNIPGFVTFLRLPVLNMMSHNRFVFASSFALLVLAAMGLEALLKMRAPTSSQEAPVPTPSWPKSVRHWWFICPLILISLLIWCAWRWQTPPPELFKVTNANALDRILGNFRSVYMSGVVVCIFGLMCWLYVFKQIRARWWNIPLLLLVMAFEYLRFAIPFNAQTDPALYYPARPMFSFLQKQQGRVIGVQDWPPNILSMYGLRDIRGYDGVDPARMIEVMRVGQDSDYKMTQKSARTMYYVPMFDFVGPAQVRLHPGLNMLNLRWLIFRGAIPPRVDPIFRNGTCWVVENVAALPRAFVPRSIKPAAGEQTTLSLIAAKDFDAAAISYVDGTTDVSEAVGKAAVVSEVSDEVTLRATMETPGVVVLADQWYPGWRAWVDGKEVSIHRINHVLRGVSVPAGTSTIIYRYQPASFTLGLWLMAGAGALLLILSLNVRLSLMRGVGVNHLR